MKAFVLACSPLLAAGAATAGVTVQMLDHGKLQTFQVEGNKMRIDDWEGRGRTLTFDGDAKILRIFDTRSRTYGESNAADMRQQGEKLKQQMAQAKASMEKEMASLPPEQRKAMEEMMRKMGGGSQAEEKQAERKYKPTGEKKGIAGQRCEVYRVIEGKSSDEEQCIVPWSAGVLKKDDLKALESFADFWGEAVSGMGVTRQQMRMQFDAMRSAPGFPAQTVDLSDGRRQVQSEMKSLARAGIPAEKFLVPPGYKKAGSAIGLMMSEGEDQKGRAAPADEEDDDAEKK
jgi:hypothetical protein